MFKLFALNLLVLFLMLSCSPNKKVGLYITAKKQYCGGAKPTPQMVNAMNQPVPYSRRMMMLVSTTGKVDSVRTDSLGKLNLFLKTGTYHVFEPWRFYKTVPLKGSLSEFDEGCLNAEWKRPNKVIRVTASGYTVVDSSEITLYCEWRQPCLSEGSSSPVPE